MSDGSKARNLIRPYGDRKDDGVVQISFVLPVSVSEKAREAAAQVARKLGLGGVVARAPDYFNPFLEILEKSSPRVLAPATQAAAAEVRS